MTSLTGAAAAARQTQIPTAGPCRLRRADPSDAVALTQIEREAFPTQWPPIQFRRELKRPRTSYVVAVCDLTPWPGNSIGWDGHPYSHPRGRDGSPRLPGFVTRLLRNLKQIAFIEPPEEERDPPRDSIAGFVGMWFVADLAHIVSIGVRECERRKGVGELLTIGAFREAQRRGANELTLEVRESNHAARALYRKYRFSDVGRRKRYYMDNREDAIIMTTPPITDAEYATWLDELARDHASRWGHSVSAEM